MKKKKREREKGRKGQSHVLLFGRFCQEGSAYDFYLLRLCWKNW